MDEEGNSPPTLFDIKTGEDSETFNKDLFEEIERTNDDLYSSSLSDAKCKSHEEDIKDNQPNEDDECEECNVVKELVKKYQSHRCTFAFHAIPWIPQL